MKVGTDALLLGAWAVAQQQFTQAITVLDAGSGTGILALMLASALPHCQVDALELEALALLDLRFNVSQSLFAERITVLPGDFMAFAPATRYDLIISNPPYYTSSITAPDYQRRLARSEQGEGFGLAGLLRRAPQWLAPRGQIYLIIPAEREEELRQLAAKELLYIAALTVVESTPGVAMRLLVCLGCTADLDASYRPESQTRFTIRQSDGSYSADYKCLLAPFLSTNS